MSMPPSTEHARSAGTAAPAAAVPSVELRRITKRFGSVVACDDVSLSVRPGEIHGLLGQNGAGKSTLMKILTGLVVPDSGEIMMAGRHVEVNDPQTATALGIAMVHQHFSLVGRMRVWENAVLGELGRVDRDHARRVVNEVGERYGLAVNPDAYVDDLSTGERQRVELIKCLRRRPGLLILDEPTSVLTLAESRELFSVLRRVTTDENTTVILISHKLDEILHATDRVTIMRGGAVVARRDTAGTDARDLARAMVGREPATWTAASAVGSMDALVQGGRAATEGDVRLRLTDVRATARDGRPLLSGLSLHVRAGEILGIAGVEGNGQAALGDLLSSLLDLDGGTVEVGGSAVPTGEPGAMHRAGVGVVPEDRHASGCVLDMSVAENLVLTDLDQVSGSVLVSPRKLRERAARLIEEFDIAVPSPDTPMRLLSGGNQQKVVLARELAARPTVLVAAQPTRGLDVGATEYMTERIHQAARDGIAVLLISTELEEILTLAHRVAVIHRGAIVGEMTRADVDLERLGLMMGGRAA
ncbi:simple sugar transport system ATP-binding protein [Sinosporangium album]|uniref:Simple sugar transport system ATP-binding protein n=1 Tax=Sinosporangium album TaxID=504805 RepID=A0A1G7TZ03_9ACTN|nr:ABC transporter ATP-binding protein [Sinosporangium album]SDG40635.1 simple sugar transport system ATP-binding protein [Sinosporangium album]